MITTKTQKKGVLSRDEELKLILSCAKSLKHENDGDFRSFLLGCRAILEMTDQEIANKLLVSRPTISRWMSGKTIPHRAMRQSIINWIVGELKQRLKQRKERNPEIQAFSAA